MYISKETPEEKLPDTELIKELQQDFDTLQQFSFENKSERKTNFKTFLARKNAENKKPDSVPVLILPGFGMTISSFAFLCQEIAKNGRDVIGVHADADINIPPIKGIPSAQLKQAETIFHTLKAAGIDKVDVYAHSNGAIVSDVIDKVHPGLIRYRIFNSPVGNGESLTQLALGAYANIPAEFVRRPPLNERASEMARRTGRDLFSIIRSARRHLSQVMGIAGYKRNDANKKVAIIGGDADLLIPARTIKNDDHYRKTLARGDHGVQIFLAEETAKEVDSILTGFEKEDAAKLELN